MADQVPKNIKEERAARASEIARTMRHNYLMQQVGRECKVLFEEMQNGYWQGHSENYILVRVETEEYIKNKVKTVKIKKVENDELIGILI